MKQLLIADAGSTKTDWSLVTKSTGVIKRFSSSGINPIQQDPDKIYSTIETLLKYFKDCDLEKVYFFGAGCISKKQKILISDIIYRIFKPESIYIESDIMAACKALYGDGSGIVGILGTGSNSCYYKNGEIIDKTPSLGYILGDEGSGAALGKSLLNSVFKSQLSKTLIDKFQAEFHLEVNEVIEKVYKQPMAASFLASFSPFIKKNIEEFPELESLLYHEFDMFFIKNIKPYHQKENIGFIGSIAWTYQLYLKKIAEKHKFHVTNIIKSPMERLEKYYIET